MINFKHFDHLLKATEEVKEMLLLKHGASKALTFFRTNGYKDVASEKEQEDLVKTFEDTVHKMETPFFEVEVYWTPIWGSLDAFERKEHMVSVAKDMAAHLVKIDGLGGIMAKPIWEMDPQAILYRCMTWAVFLSTETILRIQAESQ